MVFSVCMPNTHNKKFTHTHTHIHTQSHTYIHKSLTHKNSFLSKEKDIPEKSEDIALLNGVIAQNRI